jgi:hypothetical protein
MANEPSVPDCGERRWSPKQPNAERTGVNVSGSEVSPAITEAEFRREAMELYQRSIFRMTVRAAELRREVDEIDRNIGRLHLEAMRADCLLPLHKVEYDIQQLRRCFKIFAGVARAHHRVVRRRRR